MNNVKSRLIIFEGADGVGKTTQTRMLDSTLRSRGIEAIWTQEPGGTPIGRRIRALLLEQQEWGLTAEQQLLAFTLQRDILVDALLVPALRSGRIVITDRSIISTFVYQRLGGCTPERIREVSRVVLEKLAALDAEVTVIILDVPSHVARARALETPATVNAFDEADEAEYERRRQLYVEGARSAGWEPHVVSGLGTLEEVHQRILEVLGFAEKVNGAP